MTLTIELPADVEHALIERAQHSGQTVEQVAAAMLTQAVQGGQPVEAVAMAERLAALARIGCYDTRVRAGLPPLTDEDISRDAIYEGRGL